MNVLRLSILLTLSITCGCCDKSNIDSNIVNLGSRKAAIRNEAALALARCGSAADRAVPRLASLIYDQNVGVQSSAAYALRKIDTPAAREVLMSAERKRDSRKHK